MAEMGDDPPASEHAPTRPVRVLYLVGTARSGSTLVGRVLSQFPGVAYVGEVGSIWGTAWDRSVGQPTSAFGLPPRRCGCGLPLAECPIWRQALQRLVKDLRLIRPEDLGSVVLAQRRAVLSWPKGFRGLTRRYWRQASADQLAYARTMARLYQHLADAHAAELIVDSSKERPELVTAAAALTRDVVDARVLHVVRDPRATVHAWLHRRKATSGPDSMPTATFVRAVRRWISENVQAEAVARIAPPTAVRLRYEDFALTPESMTASLGKRLGLRGPCPVRADQIQMSVCHTAGGNPGRFLTGATTIRPDEAWQLGRRSAESLATLLATYPLARTYGYGRRAAKTAR